MTTAGKTPESRPHDIEPPPLAPDPNSNHRHLERVRLPLQDPATAWAPYGGSPRIHIPADFFALQMLSRRIVRATPLRQAALAATRRLVPVAQQQQQRTYIPDSINGADVINRKFPDPPALTEAEDPGMVSGGRRDKIDEDVCV